MIIKNFKLIINGGDCSQINMVIIFFGKKYKDINIKSVDRYSPLLPEIFIAFNLHKIKN